MSCQHLDRFDDVFALLGGATGLAALTGRERSAVYVWRAKRLFPPSTYRLIMDLLADRGFTASIELWDFEQPDDPKPEPEHSTA